jgi:aquaporin Z
MLKVLLGEILGTFILLSSIIIWGKPIPIALGLLIAILLFRYISGANFNPAVSFLMFMNGTMNGQTVLLYVSAQLIGALLAYYIWNSNIGKEVKTMIS